nr:N-6 DNA methylase [Dietzia sp. DQ11-71]
MFELLDSLPLLHGADIDIFGEVYQAIGDDAVKKAFGEYFTGRHIIGGVVPLVMKRAGVDTFDSGIEGKSIADIACGTGGFLTETLRFIRRAFSLSDEEAGAFAEESFYGYDLSSSNASRARVNMYFAGDGFSAIEGGVDTLDPTLRRGPGRRKFDFILTNPPYGSSAQHHLLHETFLMRMIDLLKPSSGWGLIVLPTGTLENPRSSSARFDLLKRAQVTDVISLPKHAFAPYTTQRTGIVIFRKRPKPLEATTWPDLVRAVQHERVSLFVVKNDGFANSDKRFPTKRKASDGSWCHDDLSPWLDSDGSLRPSRIVDALIHENGDPEHYGRFSFQELRDNMLRWGADRGSGIELLPDSYLTPRAAGVSAQEFVSRATRLVYRAQGKVESRADDVPVLNELGDLLSVPVFLSDAESDSYELQNLFTIKKGNTNLTEAAIYEGYDPDGIPVYGGGVSKPSQTINEDATTSKGKPVTVFNGPAIVLSVDGSSGAMQVVEDGKFAANHHAAVLKPKREGINLHLVAQQAEARLKALASNKTGSATLTMGTIESLQIQLPSDDILVESISSARETLTSLRRILV